jgi:hypothetical protein
MPSFKIYGLGIGLCHTKIEADQQPIPGGSCEIAGGGGHFISATAYYSKLLN